MNFVFYIFFTILCIAIVPEVTGNSFLFDLVRNYTRIECLFASDKPVEVHWYYVKGGGVKTRIVPDSTYNITNLLYTSNNYSSVLTIQITDFWEDERKKKYICQLSSQPSGPEFVYSRVLVITNTTVNHDSVDGIIIKVEYVANNEPKFECSFMDLKNVKHNVLQSNKYVLHQQRLQQHRGNVKLIIVDPQLEDSGTYNITLDKLRYREISVAPEYIQQWRNKFIIFTPPPYKANISADELTYRPCLKMPESRQYFSINRPNNRTCFEVNCVDSQLRLINKRKIDLHYNDYRLEMAKKYDIKSMLVMVWHWTLELEAIQVVQNCPEHYTNEFEYSRVTIPPRDVIGLAKGLTCELNVATMKNVRRSVGGNQDDFADGFQHLLTSYNIMRDLDENGKFSRASALFFGCAMTVSTQKFDTYVYFACVYCTKETSLELTYETCPAYSFKGIEKGDINRPRLCKTSYVSLYMCESLKGCVDYNPFILGLIEEFTLINTNYRPYVLESIYHKYASESDASTTLFGRAHDTWRLDLNGTGYVQDERNRPEGWFYAYEPVPELAYKFNRLDTRLLNESTKQASHNLMTSRDTKVPVGAKYPTMQPVRVIRQRHLCCAFVFLWQFAMACLASFVVYYAMRRLHFEKAIVSKKNIKKKTKKKKPTPTTNT